MSGLPGRRHAVLLEIDLTELPVDPDPDDPIARLRARNRPQLRPLLRTLHEAGGDPSVTGLIAKVGGALPWAAMNELRIGVAAFAASGKPTVAWAETFGENSGDMTGYVLASAFDEIWLQPGGDLGMLGVGVEATFLRGALDKLGVEPQLEQRHEYKNAADLVTRTGLTDAHRESLDHLAGSVLTDAVRAIAQGRSMDEQDVRRLVDSGPHIAAEAHAAGLVDRLGYRDQAYDAIRTRVGDSAQLLFADRWTPRRRPHLPRHRRGHVALVDIRGGITSGRTRRGPTGRNVGSDSVTAALRAAADDEHAYAVLLHVDSPGGSAVASESIWREVTRVREAGKPVVVAMGSAAASGGYYVSCPADAIVALPTTLTGSIGVFGGKFVVNDLQERMGLTTAGIEHGARALMYSPHRRFSSAELERLVASIDAVYDDFVAKVAAGRGRTVDEIAAIARGRVWTGRDAVELGLVDELGGLRDAARLARARGGLRDDAPVRAALHVPPIARLGRPKNSEDPRALARTVRSGLPRLDEIAADLGLPIGSALRMPPLRLR